MKVIIVMGVAGSGKTTIGKLLAEKLHWKFSDADDYHPPANVAKMSAGHPLTDADRAPWLEILRSNIHSWIDSNVPTVLACSALRSSYRDILHVDDNVGIVYLKGDFQLFETRLSSRHGHFMKTGMLASQFETLEEPKGACTIDASKDPDTIVQEILAQLGVQPRT